MTPFKVTTTPGKPGFNGCFGGPLFGHKVGASHENKELAFQGGEPCFENCQGNLLYSLSAKLRGSRLSWPWKIHIFARTVWPSGLRRWLQAPVRKGMGLITISYSISYLYLVDFQIPETGNGFFQYSAYKSLTYLDLPVWVPYMVPLLTGAKSPSTDLGLSSGTPTGKCWYKSLLIIDLVFHILEKC